MHLLIIIRVALRSLRRTSLRSGLTVLGIIIGVAAVIAMVSIGNGAKARIERTLASIDINRILLNASMPRRLWRNGEPIPVPPNDGLRLEDYTAIRNEISGIAAASVQVFARDVTLAAQGRSSHGQVIGFDVDGVRLSSRKILRGASFGETDVRSVSAVCLISNFVARNLFDSENPLGQLVRVKGVPFLVIGVLADSGPSDATGAMPGDSTVLIPYTSLMQRLERNPPIIIVIKAFNPGELARIQQQVSDLLERRRGERQAEFVAGNVETAVRSYREGTRTMVLLLGSIAGISLLVGGIGVMNIMMVSVTERTREIGIRLAIGTRCRDVLRQFLIESTVLTIIGGVLGIVVGIGAAFVLSYLNGWPTRITITSVVGAFLCSAIVGIFFGYYPARQAARLDPIEALRSE